MDPSGLFAPDATDANGNTPAALASLVHLDIVNGNTTQAVERLRERVEDEADPFWALASMVSLGFTADRSTVRKLGAALVRKADERGNDDDHAEARAQHAERVARLASLIEEAERLANDSQANAGAADLFSPSDAHYLATTLGALARAAAAIVTPNPQ